MRQLEKSTYGQRGTPQREARLDLVVPFTTKDLTLVALTAANQLGAGLDPVIRLLKIQLVPYPLDPGESPISLGFLEEQLRELPSELPVRREIRLARDFEAGLTGALHDKSLVLLATRRQPWRTSVERLGAALSRAGYKVLMVSATTCPQQRRRTMPDFIYSLLIAGFFLLAWCFTRACEKL